MEHLEDKTEVAGGEKEEKREVVHKTTLNARQEAVVRAIIEAMERKSGVKGREIVVNAGYSVHTAHYPGRVLNHPAVQAAVRERALKAGITEDKGFRHLKTLGKTVTLRTEYFPSEEESGITDDEIRETFKKCNFKVLFITKTKSSDGRAVRYAAPNWMANKEAADMIFNIWGTYAPRRIEGKHTVGRFTLSDLRKWREQNNQSSV